MLSLRNLAKLAGEEEKGIFPYKLLDKNLKEIVTTTPDMFENNMEYGEFTEKYGTKINTFDILEEYCKNDAKITKNSIIKYWEIIEKGGLSKSNRILTAAKLSVENFFSTKPIIKKKILLKFDRIIRGGYFGGRTEVFGNLKEGEVGLHYD